MNIRNNHFSNHHHPNWIWMTQKNMESTHLNIDNQYLSKSKTFFIEWSPTYFTKEISTGPWFTDVVSFEMPTTYEQIEEKFKPQGSDIDSLFIDVFEKEIKKVLAAKNITGPVYIKSGVLSDNNIMNVLFSYRG